MWLTEIAQEDKDIEVHGKLDRDTDDQTPVEDGGWRPLLVESLKRLRKTEEDKEETDTHSHVGCLVITHLDAVQVEGAHRVGRDKTVQGQNLVHLESGCECLAALTNQSLNTLERGELKGKWSSDASISELQSRITRLSHHNLLILRLVLLHDLLLLRKSFSN